MAKRVGIDKWLFFTTLVLVVTGLVMVFSASAVVDQERYHSAYTFVLTQAVWAGVGVLAMLALMNVDVSRYNSPRFIYPVLCFTTVLLVLVFLMPNSHHTHRWIRFGDFFTLQPSEIAKPVLVFFLAWFLQTRLGAMTDWKRTLIPAALIPMAFIFLVGTEPDLGTALVLAGATCMLLVLAGMEWKILFAAICAALPVVAAAVVLVPWRLARWVVFLHPESDPTGPGYHIYQSLIAVGTGGVTGRGYMEGMQKLFYLPEASTDFIFANIAEEWGFIGSIVIVLLFGLFGARGLRAAFRCRDPFARLVAFGITTTILLQAFFNISVVLSLVPNKGIPLPLISHGGTSLFCTLASIGVLLNISRKAD
ncbi:MAG: putative lipid II flippase FtsW [Terracidiphilus sp.]|jgi:cell division protein FtsW